MATRIFRVDLKQGALDFMHTATEPGLPMLDRQGANYQILKRWLGDYAAEPEWRGDSVNFYVNDGERGRLEDVDCMSVTKADLEKGLKEDLDQLRLRISKIRPDTNTEQTLHRIVTQTFKRMLENLDGGNFDCFVFKYREGREAWRLIWCWGYQRADQEPLPALVCTDPECTQLFVRRPTTKGRCPGCQSEVKRRKRKIAGFAMSGAGSVLFTVAAVLFFLLNQPHLVVTPEKWGGPTGSKVEFKVQYKRWYFFSDDVSLHVVPQSADSRVLEFDGHGTVARARHLGRTKVSFRFVDRVKDVDVLVGPPKPPKSLEIEPASAALGIDSTVRPIVWGVYDDKDMTPRVDLSEVAQLDSKDTDVAFLHDGYVQGASAGATSVKASYLATLFDEKPLEATMTVEVKKVDYKSLDLGLIPSELGIGQAGKLRIDARDDGSGRYSVLGSTKLGTTVAPPEVAEVEREMLVGKTPGAGELTALFNGLTGSLKFNVTSKSMLPADLFAVTPKQVEIYAAEYFTFDVKVGDPAAQVMVTSSDPLIVEATGGYEVAGRKAGTAQLTFAWGDKSQTVDVTVKDAKFKNIYIVPDVLALTTGRPTKFKVIGKTPEGDEVTIAPDRLDWVREPALEHVNVNRDTLEVFGLSPTTKSQTLEVAHAGLTAEALVTVKAGTATTLEEELAMLEAGFGAYGPIPLGTALAPGLVYGDGGVVVSNNLPTGSLLTGLPAGAVVTSIGGTDLSTIPPADLKGYLASHLVNGAPIRYRLADGTLGGRILGTTILQTDVSLASVRAIDPTDIDFAAEFQINVIEAGDYRVVDAANQPLSDWTPIAARGIGYIKTTKIKRTSDDDYDVFVERKIGERVRRFQLQFKLKADQASPGTPLPTPAPVP